MFEIGDIPFWFLACTAHHKPEITNISFILSDLGRSILAHNYRLCWKQDSL